MSYRYLSFYTFTKFPQAELPQIKLRLKSEAGDILGLVILASEGMNSTFCGTAGEVERFKQVIEALVSEFAGGRQEIFFKESVADFAGFSRFSVKIRDEIVTSSRRMLLDEWLGSGVPTADHLTPEQWDAMLGRDDVVVLDTRNDYEYRIGHFRGAINPQIRNFSDFQSSLRELALPEDKQILMYCTGGIRCEKAIFEARELGFKNVFQLHGGILNYLEAQQRLGRAGAFVGECFVFDNRVALTESLMPSERYRFCPSCGEAADLQGTHEVRDDGRVVCAACLAAGSNLPTMIKSNNE